MITLQDIQNILGDQFFNGDLTLAGLGLFAIVIILVFVLTKNVFQSLVVGLIVTGIFSYMGIITSDMMILLIIIIVLGLALTAKNAVTGNNRR
jgi:hypothetical protein